MKDLSVCLLLLDDACTHRLPPARVGHGYCAHISLPEGTKLPLQALVRLNERWGRQIGPVPEGAGYRIRLNAKECKYILDTALEIVQMICGE